MEHTQSLLYLDDRGVISAPLEAFMPREFVCSHVSSKGVRRDKGCAECGEACQMVCQQCSLVRACGAECFARLWPTHKAICKAFRGMRACRRDCISHFQYFMGVHMAESVRFDDGVFAFAGPRLYADKRVGVDRTLKAGAKLKQASLDFLKGVVTLTTRSGKKFVNDWSVKEGEMKDILIQGARKVADDVGVESFGYSLMLLTRARLDDYLCEGQSISILFRAKLNKDLGEYKAGETVPILIYKANGWIRIVGNRGTHTFKALEGVPSFIVLPQNSLLSAPR